ncbi:39S ribosomal protein L55, mitochondrial [Cephus cinctus]|uniref:39S ribosomal protein L55, mitochondrial n=1 Tax=Cephus cinctus TaxID=211228 RepID=A0AAJ7CDL5_CEPCN|nr:39S ribosomal protein L55, mitochondrial [Cephus cinctus]
MKSHILALLSTTRNSLNFSRNFNCWTAGITKIHRTTYERTYPTVLVNPDGSSIIIPYHEPRGIIKLPLDIFTLSEAERKARLERRKPKTRVKIDEDIEDDFDVTKYLNFKKK